MLSITVPESEQWDAVNNEFISIKETTLQLEHSLISISKWEAKWQKPFLSNETKSVDQIMDYIQCMTVNTNVDPMVYKCITNENLEEVNKYIGSPMTATWFHEDPNAKKSREIITSELIYYWMIALNIPFECQKWHLNRLLTLIRVCNIKNQPPKKQSRNEILSRNAALNEARRKQLNTKG